MWKGTWVDIVVWDTDRSAVESRVRQLDTDTMADLFEQYDPKRYSFEVRPADVYLVEG